MILHLLALTVPKPEETLGVKYYKVDKILKRRRFKTKDDEDGGQFVSLLVQEAGENLADPGGEPLALFSIDRTNKSGCPCFVNLAYWRETVWKIMDDQATEIMDILYQVSPQVGSLDFSKLLDKLSKDHEQERTG